MPTKRASARSTSGTGQAGTLDPDRGSGGPPVAASPALSVAGRADGAEPDSEVPPRLVQAFRRDLTRGVYYPRERLVEADLAVRYGTTRAAIREALVQLAAEGFVETQPKRGARVRPMSIAEAIEIAEVRRALEPLCAGRAAERATETERAEIVAMAAGLRAAAEENHVGDYLDINARFHSLIYRTSRHETSRRILEQFQYRPIDRYIPGVFRHRPPTGWIEDHEAVATAIAAEDAPRAETAMFDYITVLIETLRHYESVIS